MSAPGPGAHARPRQPSALTIRILLFVRILIHLDDRVLDCGTCKERRDYITRIERAFMDDKRLPRCLNCGRGRMFWVDNHEAYPEEHEDDGLEVDA